MILFLDDSTARATLAYKRFSESKRSITIWCKTVEETIDILKNYSLSEVHLDHDLGGHHYVHTAREDCGMEIIRWLEKSKNLSKFENTSFIIHSWNIPAGLEMTRRLKKLGLKVQHIPFGMTNEIFSD